MQETRLFLKYSKIYFEFLNFGFFLLKRSNFYVRDKQGRKKNRKGNVMLSSPSLSPVQQPRPGASLGSHTRFRDRFNLHDDQQRTDELLSRVDAIPDRSLSHTGVLTSDNDGASNQAKVHMKEMIRIHDLWQGAYMW